LNKKPLKITKIDVFERRGIEIPSNFSSPFFSPIGDRFYNLNGLAKKLAKNSRNKEKGFAKSDWIKGYSNHQIFYPFRVKLVCF
jgi:hypothetical protein